MPINQPDAGQIRAALGLLRWENNDLAKACGITAQSISNIKNQATRPQPRILESIRRVLEFNGIEFIDNSGVRLKRNEIEVFEGPDRFHDFTDYLYEHLRLHGGEVCISAVDETLFGKFRKDLTLHRQRMKELVEQGKVHVRILTTKPTPDPIFAEYRRLPKHEASFTAFYSFGNCLALISFAQQPAPYVVLHKSGPFAEAFRQNFNIIWANAERFPKSGK